MSIKYFDDKYVKPLKNQDTTNLAYVNVHDANGNDGGLKCYLKNDLLYCDNVMTYGKYGESGPVTNFSIYNSSKKLIFQQGYIYKKHEFLDLLTEIDNYSIGGKISFRTIFIYTAFDRKGNWIKRTEIGKSKTGRITRYIKTVRKITYY